MVILDDYYQIPIPFRWRLSISYRAAMNDGRRSRVELLLIMMIRTCHVFYIEEVDCDETLSSYLGDEKSWLQLRHPSSLLLSCRLSPSTYIKKMVFSSAFQARFSAFRFKFSLMRRRCV